ncbi:DUF2971 domain-containing protein [Caulobacter vibrioides]|nr:DUF2971 domain-containing protein [Caulobacter vibrioides]
MSALAVSTDAPPINPLQSFLDRFWLQLESEFWNASDTPPVLAHFTRLKTAQSILQQGSIRQTNPRCGNDKQEIERAYSVAQECVNKYAPDFADAINWRMSYSGFEHYVACFSGANSTEELDNLNSWQAYGDDGRGAAIILNSQILIGDIKSSSSNVIRRVSYDFSELREHVRRLLIWAVPIISDLDEDSQLDAQLHVGAQIQNVCAYFKDESFSYENEVRVLRLDTNRSDIEFHETDEFFLPFTKLPLSVGRTLNADIFENEQLTGAVQACMVGPSLDQDRATAVMASTLFSLGHEDPRKAVLRSMKPYRSNRSS